MKLSFFLYAGLLLAGVAITHLQTTVDPFTAANNISN